MEYSKKPVVLVGPFRSSKERGKPFDDGIHSAVKGLVIFHVPGFTIASVQFEYDDGGCSTWSDNHGLITDTKDVRFKGASIKFNYPDEFLTSVLGCCQEDETGSFVTTLAFKTNKNDYGPFGSTQCNPKDCFTIDHVPGSKIVGFHGRSNNNSFAGGIASIGAYLLKPHDQQIECPPSTRRQVGYPSQPKFKNRTQYQDHYAIKDNVISENKGKGNGTFHFDDTSQNPKECSISNHKVTGNEGDCNGAIYFGRGPRA